MKNPFRAFTILLIFTAFVGSRLVQIGFGDYHITPYRLLCVIGLFLIPINKYSIKPKTLIYSYLLFLVSWIIYSLILYIISTPDKTAYWEIFFFILCGTITTYYIGTFIDDLGMLRRSFGAIEIASIFPFFFAIYEIFVGNYLFVDSYNADFYSHDSSEWSSFGIRVPVSTFSNPNDFAFMVLVALISAYILFKLAKGRRQYYHFIMLAISAFLVIATQSRAAFISLILFFLAIFIYKFYSLNSRKKLLFITILPLLIGSSLFCFFLYYDLFEPLLMIDIEGGSSDVIRSNLIQNGFIFLESSYYMGVGLGNIEYHMIHHAVFNTREYLNIHNWWMEILVSSGILIFIWYVILYTKLLFNICKGFRKIKDPEVKFIYFVLFSYMVIFILDSMSSSCLAKIECSWIIIALLFTVPGLRYKDKIILRNKGFAE